MANGETKTSEIKKPLTYEERILEAALKAMEKKTKEVTTTKLESGESPTNILKGLMDSLQQGGSTEDLMTGIQTLSQTQVPIAGSRKGILALGDLLTGQGFDPSAPRTQAMGLEEAVKQTGSLANVLEKQTALQKAPLEETKLGMETLQKAQEVVKETDIGKQRELDWKVKEKRALKRIDIEDVDKAQKSAIGTYRFLQQFGRSYEELKKFDPDIINEGFSGYIKRRKAKIAESLDMLPETKAMSIMILPLANGMAREIEGGRVTDEDRQIYANAFANSIGNPSTTNTRLASQSVVSLIDKGADMIPSLKQLAAMDIDIFNDMISQILIEYPEIVEDIYGEGAKVIE